MKVNSPRDVRPVDARKPDEASPSAARSAAPPPDTVSTQESARLAAAIAAVRNQVSVARAAQLQSIEAAVRQGTFRPDPARIAQRILQDAEISAALQAMLEK